MHERVRFSSGVPIRLFALAFILLTAWACDFGPRGTVTRQTYFSTTTGVNRHCYVYTPNGYTETETYGVLYVLHGIGGTETEWIDNGAQGIMDALYGRGMVQPMILVFPNGRAMNPDGVPADIFSAEAQAAFANFENDLFNDLIPFIESTYPVYTDREHRGICGLSMGAGQALDFGVGHPESFAFVGAFSPAPNTDTAQFNVAPGRPAQLIWILCGQSDGLLNIAQNADAFLTTNGVPHTFQTMPGAHDWNVWQAGLREFTPMIFR
jgi:enterochelin esterase-like enzyme